MKIPFSPPDVMGMRNRALLILGAGQYGQVAFETAKAMGCFAKIAFLDDSASTAIGDFESYKSFVQEYECAFVAIGNPKLRMQWIKKLKEAGYELPSLIHPRAYISATAKLGEGSIVEPSAVVNTEAEVATGVLICAGAVVNHNSVIGCCCQIDCNAVVASGATVPDGIKVESCIVYR